jgi:hypothetical protein
MVGMAAVRTCAQVGCYSSLAPGESTSTTIVQVACVRAQCAMVLQTVCTYFSRETIGPWSNSGDVPPRDTVNRAGVAA